MGNNFSFQRICKEVNPKCSRKGAMELFCQLVNNLLERDPKGTVVIQSFYHVNIVSQLDAYDREKDTDNSNDPLDRFMTRDTQKAVPKPLRQCGKAFKQYLIPEDKVSEIRFRKVQDVICSIFRQKPIETLVQNLMKLYEEFPVDEAEHLKLKKLAASEPEKALTWIVLFSLMISKEAWDFSKHIENENKAYEDCLAEKSSKYHISVEELQADLNLFFDSGSHNFPEYMPQGEDMLELIWKYADSQRKESDKKADIARKGLQYAKQLYGDTISMDIYPYVMDFIIELINFCWRKNRTEEQKRLMTEADRLEKIRYDCTDEPDETKTHGVSITAKLQKAEGLYYSKCRDLEQCHRLEVEALRLMGSKEPEKAKLFNNRAILFRKQFNLDKAIDWYLRSLKIREKFKEEKKGSFALAQSNLGIALTLAHQFDEAEQNLREALETRRELEKDNATEYADKVSISAYTFASYMITKAACEHAMTFNHSTSLEKQWSSKIAALLAESWKTFDNKNSLTDREQILCFNHLIIEAVYLTLLSSLSEDARCFGAKTFAVKQMSNNTSNKSLLLAANNCFVRAEKWITEKMNEEEKQAEYPDRKMTYGDRQYGIYYVNAVIGRLIVSDALHGNAEKTQADYQKITDYISILMTDPSIAAEQTYITSAAFYGEFRMRHTEFAHNQNIIKMLTDAKAAAEKLAKHGEKTHAALLPALNSLTYSMTYLSGAANEIHTQNLTKLFPYLMMQL